MSKTIYDAYQEIKQREIKELKDALRNAGGEVEFREDKAPIVMVNFDGYSPHPADVVITRVRLKDDTLLIDGQEKEASGCAEWLKDESPIEVDDIAYGHLDFITSEIVSKNKRRENLLLETIVQLSADIYRQVYDHYECYTSASSEIIRLARQFEKELNWQEDDERDYIIELDKFEREYLESLGHDKEDKGLRKLWMRLGVSLHVTDAEADTLLSDDSHHADDILRSVIRDGRFSVDGNSYIPRKSVEVYNNENATDYKVGDVDFELNVY